MCIAHVYVAPTYHYHQLPSQVLQLELACMVQLHHHMVKVFLEEYTHLLQNDYLRMCYKHVSLYKYIPNSAVSASGASDDGGSCKAASVGDDISGVEIFDALSFSKNKLLLSQHNTTQHTTQYNNKYLNFLLLDYLDYHLLG
jgi:hypothetical protein